MKLKIFYDGNPTHTKVVDQETGQMVEGVVSAHVDIEPFGAVATLVLMDFEADLSNVKVNDGSTQGIHGDGSSRDNQENLEQTSQ
jgi:hypothetical protein